MVCVVVVVVVVWEFLNKGLVNRLDAAKHMPGHIGVIFGGDDPKEYNEAKIKIDNKAPPELRFHSGSYNDHSSVMPGWTCCGNMDEASQGCEIKKQPSPQEICAAERDARHKAAEQEENKVFGIEVPKLKSLVSRDRHDVDTSKFIGQALRAARSGVCVEGRPYRYVHSAAG